MWSKLSYFFLLRLLLNVGEKQKMNPREMHIVPILLDQQHTNTIFWLFTVRENTDWLYKCAGYVVKEKLVNKKIINNIPVAY